MKRIELDTPKKRRPYKKPQLQRVCLTPEEAVLGGCKVSTGAGPSGSGCEQEGLPCTDFAS